MPEAYHPRPRELDPVYKGIHLYRTYNGILLASSEAVEQAKVPGLNEEQFYRRGSFYTPKGFSPSYALRTIQLDHTTNYLLLIRGDPESRYDPETATAVTIRTRNAEYARQLLQQVEIFGPLPIKKTLRRGQYVDWDKLAGMFTRARNEDVRTLGRSERISGDYLYNYYRKSLNPNTPRQQLEAVDGFAIELSFAELNFIVSVLVPTDPPSPRSLQIDNGESIVVLDPAEEKRMIDLAKKYQQALATS